LDCKEGSTPFTEERGEVTKKKGRMALLVSSTSWTPDEDFSLLFDALKDYSLQSQQIEKEEEGRKCTRLILIITGKGPNKEYYEKKMKEEKMSHVLMKTMWLSAEDYSALLGSADLGISLHSSSSGLDLPMKVVDMFGCGLPVCALNFKWSLSPSPSPSLSPSPSPSPLLLFLLHLLLLLLHLLFSFFNFLLLSVSSFLFSFFCVCLLTGSQLQSA